MTTTLRDALSRLQSALDALARALTSGDDAAVLAAEEPLGSAVTAVAQLARRRHTEADGLREAIDGVRAAMTRCAALGRTAGGGCRPGAATPRRWSSAMTRRDPQHRDGGDPVGPQGAALILELQRLQHAFEHQLHDDPRRAPRDHRPAGRTGQARRRKGVMGRALDICLEHMGFGGGQPIPHREFVQDWRPPARPP